MPGRLAFIKSLVVQWRARELRSTTSAPPSHRCVRQRLRLFVMVWPAWQNPCDKINNILRSVLKHIIFYGMYWQRLEHISVLDITQSLKTSYLPSSIHFWSILIIDLVFCSFLHSRFPCATGTQYHFSQNWLHVSTWNLEHVSITLWTKIDLKEM